MILKIEEKILFLSYFIRIGQPWNPSQTQNIGENKIGVTNWQEEINGPVCQNRGPRCWLQAYVERDLTSELFNQASWDIAYPCGPKKDLLLMECPQTTKS